MRYFPSLTAERATAPYQQVGLDYPTLGSDSKADFVLA